MIMGQRAQADFRLLSNFATIFSDKLGLSATCRKINTKFFDDNRDDGGSTDLIASVSVPTNNHFSVAQKRYRPNRIARSNHRVGKSLSDSVAGPRGYYS